MAMSEKKHAQEFRVPDIPLEYRQPVDTIGVIPAQVAVGFEVSRIPNTPEAIAEAKNKGQVAVHTGDRNPLNPDEPLIANEEMFQKTPEGYLAYRGDLLVVWATAYAEAARQRAAEAAGKSLTGVKIRRVSLEQQNQLPPEAV